MAKILMSEAQEFAVLPDETIIKVEVESVEVKEVEGKNGNPSWEKLEFKFKIIEIPSELVNSTSGYADLVGGSIWGSVGARLTDHPDNKLKQWAEALLGLDLGAGFELDTDMLVGRQARGVTGQYKGKNGARHQISGLLPVYDRPTFDLGQSVPAQSSAPVVETTYEEPPF